MEFDLTVYCKECGGAVGESDDAYCNGCMQTLRDQVEELQGEVAKLEAELEKEA